ncbi:MAG: hypothetical protein ACYDCI_05395 [Candidatus Limnocylindrales bacterium]
MNRRFGSEELDGSTERRGTVAEEADLLALGREIEAIAASDRVVPSQGFEDRVLAAIAATPLPRPTGAAGLAARQGRPIAMLLALRDTWRVAWSGGRPLAVRAQAAAFVLVVVLLVGSLGGIAAIGGFGLLSSSPVGSNPASFAVPSPEPSSTENPSSSPEPSESSQPSESPGASDTGESPEPSATSHPAAGSPAAGSGSAGSGSVGSGGTPTAEPTETAIPSGDGTQILRPTETPSTSPSSSGSDDHGGG